MNSRPNQITSSDARKAAHRLSDAGKTEDQIIAVLGEEWRSNLRLVLQLSGPHRWNFWDATRFWDSPIVHQWASKHGKRINCRAFVSQAQGRFDSSDPVVTYNRLARLLIER